MITWILLLALIYAGFITAAWFLQGKLLFPRKFAGPAQVDAATLIGVQEIWLTTQDNVRIPAWFALGQGCTAASPGPVVVFAHGNGELIDHNTQIIEFYHALGISTLMVEYRGYGRAGGAPSQKALVNDLIMFRDWLDTRPEVDPSRVIYHGRSIGGGVITALAAERRPSVVIVESTFTSLAAMFNRYLLPGFVCRHPFRNDRVLPTLGVPVLVMHGTLDTIVPVAHGRKLASMIPGARYVEWQCGHNDLPPDHREYAKTIRAFLESAGVIQGDAATASDPPAHPQ